MKHIFVTGASGAVGAGLIPVLLAQDPDSRIHMILRADSESHLQDRARKLIAHWSKSVDSPSWFERLEWAQGDVTLPQLGMQDAIYRRLANQVTHIIHCAGNVKLNQPRDMAVHETVSSARNVIQLATEAIENGSLKKIDVTSTVGVAGRMAGLVPEQQFVEPRTFRNTYEDAKAEAEEYYWQCIERGLPLTIHRPSMVVGDSQTGNILHFQVFYYLLEFLTGRFTGGLLPRLDRVSLDIIPVDVVAEAIAICSRQPETIGRVFHLSSGEQAVPLKTLSDRYVAVCEAAGERLPKRRYTPLPIVRSFLRIAPFVTRGRFRKSLLTFPYFLAYLDEPQIFDNRQTLAYLEQWGWSVPSPANYLEPVIAFYRANRNEVRKEKSLSSRPPLPEVKTAQRDISPTP